MHSTHLKLCEYAQKRMPHLAYSSERITLIKQREQADWGGKAK